MGGANVWAADKITDVANIVSGGKYYIGATTSNKVDCYLKINGSSISTGKQEEPTEKISEATIFVLEKSENGWVIKFDGTTNYLALNTDKKGKLDVKSTPSTFKFENLGGLIYMTSQNCALRRHKVYTTKRFGTYGTGTGNNAMLDVWLMPATPAKTLTSLAISSTPTKTTYNVGEEFDPTGLVVTGIYEDNTTATITNGITWTKNPETMSLGNTSCTVTASVGEVKSEPFVVNGLKVVRTISLSIDPTTRTVVKAPVNVTLTAPEGATVYYTTNGDEPTTSSTKYTTPFDVTVSGTTVKALAVAEGAENATAEATYTIKPDQPVFSDESKTFKDAFNVTLSLPETTDATSSKIYYEIDGTATEKSKLYEDPITISAEKDGEKVILHAVVVDQYGNVGKEKYCTYTKSNAIVFDFTANPNAWGIEPSSNNNVPGDNVVAGKELKVDEVVMTSTNGTYASSNATCIFKPKKGDVSLKVYKGATITFTAPVGYNISEILFDGKNLGNLASEEETYTAPSWIGNAHSVQFSNSSKAVDIYTASIKLVAAAAEPTYTAQTLKFIAKDGKDSKDYYATFSSDKVTFITSYHVIPYVVTVTKGKIDMNSKMFKSEKTTIGSEEVDGYYIPANTGILLYSDAENADYYTVENKTVDAFAESTNMLKPAPANGGVFEATDGYKYYKLAYDNFDKQEGLGFYWGAPEGGAFYVKAGTAYLAVRATETTAKGFTLNGEATGIEGVNANVENAKAIYNLNGQRVASMAKPGLYIVNGKKVVRK